MRPRLALLVVSLLCLAACSSAGARYPKTIVAAGDFGGSSQAGATARVMAAQHPAVILGLGDFEYEYDFPGLFRTGFAKEMRSHGVLLRRIRPVAGPTHDVRGPWDKLNYIRNWGRNPFVPYSFNVGPSWHVIALPSPIYRYDMPLLQRRTLTWLRRDLNRNRAPCVIAYWHEPFFTNSTSEHSATEGDYTRPWVNALYAHRADILLAGHQHGYARFAPQTPSKRPSYAAGLRQYIVGTGGIGFYPWSTGEPNLVTQQANTYGALKLVLYRRSWSTQFLRSGGGHYTDRSAGRCH